ncbi:MAG: phosphoglycolate phosphatase [Betaproteobacteria bacterium]|nr:MAG: phosphoglycolate phosphatase [Betaproteobacteria bacterium]
MNALNFPLPVRAVAIDLDGTMLDTVEDLAIAVNHTLTELGLPTLELELVRTFVGKGLANLVQRSITASLGRDPEPALFARALPLYEANYERVNGETTTIYPGVREGLEALAQAGYALACITNKSSRFTGPLLERIGFARYFSLVLSGDSLPKKKPDPLPLAHTARTFGVEPAQMLMIGDSINDAQAARAAGCPIFCVTYGYNEGHDVRTLDVDAIVPSLIEAARLIRRIES